jgi:hypothetical protein
LHWLDRNEDSASVRKRLGDCKQTRTGGQPILQGHALSRPGTSHAIRRPFFAAGFLISAARRCASVLPALVELAPQATARRSRASFGPIGL